jgi:WS/DGAT C-terminal domain
MTAIGRFALASETIWNPSIVTFVIQLQNNTSHHSHVVTKHDVVQLWQQRNMYERHPRFHQVITDTDPSSIASTSMKQFHTDHVTDISQHISESTLPVNRQALQKQIQYMQLKQWDLSHSLWHLIVCNSHEKYNSNGDGTRISTYNQFDMCDVPEKDSTLTTAPSKNTNTLLLPTLLLFRGHHVLADGASMAAAFADLFDESALLRNQIIEAMQFSYRRTGRSKSVWQRLWKQWLQFVQFCIGTIQALWYMVCLLFYQTCIDNHPWRYIKQQHDSTHATAKNNGAEAEGARIVSWSDVASIDQVKWVAETISQWNDGDATDTINSTTKSTKITVNDIFIACVTAAMAKQLDSHRQRLLHTWSALPGMTKKDEHRHDSKLHTLSQQKYIHVAVPVHLKGGVVLPDESVGNNIGAMVVRVPSEMEHSNADDDDCIQRLFTVSREMHALKRTPMAILGHITAKVLSYATAYNILPLSWTSRLYAASNAGSMVVISNNRGPSIPVHLDGHRIESMVGFVPLPPGIPVGVAVMSYAGRVNCTLSAEPWAIPDGDQFMIWILEEYLRLVNAAKAKQSGLHSKH